MQFNLGTPSGLGMNPNALPLQQGASGLNVMELQEVLAKLGYLDQFGKPLVPDRYFGPKTEFAVRSFQRNNGLPETGVVSAATWTRIQEALAAAPTGEQIVVGMEKEPGLTSFKPTKSIWDLPKWQLGLIALGGISAIMLVVWLFQQKERKEKLAGFERVLASKAKCSRTPDEDKISEAEELRP